MDPKPSFLHQLLSLLFTSLISCCLSGVACGTGSISEKTTIEVIALSLWPKSLKSFLRTFHLPLTLSLVPMWTMTTGSSPASPSRLSTQSATCRTRAPGKQHTVRYARSL
ncbi:hypothetical protein GDO81_026508 [Engystomops pustulosus]|uniref:Secreted protein n=1 Tax=Engystomops pustulosus TaxID=76066 RepID=A0AAV6YM75_ENGPU|nr:hypothetical protein GDO81_026508 [Engystomops pustulosus]